MEHTTDYDTKHPISNLQKSRRIRQLLRCLEQIIEHDEDALGLVHSIMDTLDAPIAIKPTEQFTKEQIQAIRDIVHEMTTQKTRKYQLPPSYGGTVIVDTDNNLEALTEPFITD